MGVVPQTSLMPCSLPGIGGLANIASPTPVEAEASIASQLSEIDGVGERCASAVSSYCNASSVDRSASIAAAPAILPRLLGGDARAKEETISARREEARQMRSRLEQLREVNPGLEDVLYGKFGPCRDWLRRLIDDLEQGYPIPLCFLHNSGGSIGGIFRFMCMSPLESEFPFAYCFHPDEYVLKSIGQFSLRRGSNLLSLEIDISPLQMMEWLLQDPEGIRTDANYVAISCGHVKSFREFLRERGIRPKVLIPGSPDVQLYAKAISPMQGHADVIVQQRRYSRQEKTEDALDRVGLLEEARDRLSPEVVRLREIVHLTTLAASPEQGAEARRQLQGIPFSEVLSMGAPDLFGPEREQFFRFLRANGFGTSFFVSLYDLMLDRDLAIGR